MKKQSTPKKKSPRKHLPALSPDKLELTLQRIELLPIGKAAKAKLISMLQAAANPNAERADVVLKTLEPERQANAQEVIARVGETFTGVTSRGQAALSAMSEEAWNALVNDD